MTQEDIENLRRIIAEELGKQLNRIAGPDNGMISTEEKARQMGIKPETLRRKARRGEIDCVKIGNSPQARLRFNR